MTVIRDTGRTLLTALRLMLGLAVTADGFAASFLSLALTVLLGFVPGVLIDWALAGTGAHFYVYGVSARLGGWCLLALLLAVLHARSGRFDLIRLIAAVAAGWFWAGLGTAAVLWSWPRLYGLTGDGPWQSWPAEPFMLAAAVALAYGAVAYLWHAAETVSQAPADRIALGLMACCALAALTNPSLPIIAGERTDWDHASLWEYAQSASSASASTDDSALPPLNIEETYARQPALLDAALAAIAPERPGVHDLYLVTFAGDAGTAVFAREAQAARTILDERMGTSGRSVVLANSPDTVETLPLASLSNLEQVLNSIGHKLDPAEDVLVLFLTSHGNRGLFAIRFGDLGLNDLTPDKLTELIARSGIRNRVVIVSACYSGSFIANLEAPRALVITAARSDRSSFGCSSERDWTYFGDAFINQALRKTRSFSEAFAMAKDLVAGWEKKEGLTPSEPQMSMGSDIRPLLDEIAR